jgi:ribonuclease HII
MPPKQNNLTLPVGPFEIGCDEVGRGPLFGRVYAAAVILPALPEHTDWSRGIKDSKKYASSNALKRVAGLIKAKATAYAIAFREAEHVDRVNILQATQDAMHEAIRRVLEQINALPVGNNQTVLETVRLFVDGNYFRPFPGLSHTCVEGGDGIYISIAAASVLAKEARDDWIAELCGEHPDLVDKYGLDTNKGYGTKRHIEGLREHGRSPWHRRSFHVRGLDERRSHT